MKGRIPIAVPTRRLLAPAPLSLVAAAIVASGAIGHVRAGAASPGARPSAFAVVLAVPSAGDVSYGVARVRIAHDRRSLAPGPETAGQTVFAARVGGLAIVARSRRWPALRATTRVYVVVARVAGQDASVRDIAFFVVRRLAVSSRPAAGRAAVEFSIANATPAIGSFWVRGVDRRGYAEIFNVRDILATAVGNWSRYLKVLELAHALAAAMHPLQLDAASARAPTAGTARAGQHARAALWIGGQRPTRRARAIFRLIVDTVGTPAMYAAAKQSPIVLDFITHELGNPRLARRWRVVTAELPLQVPDRYAAAAQEEARFTTVAAPRISRARVAFATSMNSSGQIGDNAGFPTVYVNKNGTGSGDVHWDNIPGLGAVDCGPVCSAEFPPGTYVSLNADWPIRGSEFVGWAGCDQVINGLCRVRVEQTDRHVTATFSRVFDDLTVLLYGSGSGIVADGPAQGYGEIQCWSPSPLHPFPSRACSKAFIVGGTETLTATPDPGSSFDGWTGCDGATGNQCTLMFGLADRTVVASFGAPGLTVQIGGNGFGRVTSNPPGIDCRSTCSAVFPAGPVTLTATATAGSTFDGWTGCDSTSGNTCTISNTPGAERTATASFSKPLLQVRVTGFGRVTSSPSGIDCGSSGSVCLAAFSGGQSLTLTATAGSGSMFNSFSGCDSYSGTSCTLTMSADRGVEASFSPEPPITRVAGDGSRCASPPVCGDYGTATAARLSSPQGVAVDGAGSVYIADSADNEVRKVSADGTIIRIAGNGTRCTTAPACGDGGPATSAELNFPGGVAVDGAGNVYIADAGDNEVRKVTPGGTITTIAGNGSQCFTSPACGDGGPATSAELNFPGGVAVDGAGNVYIADAGDNEVRKVTPGGTITTIAGNGTACTTAPACGDGGAGTSAQLNFPQGVAVDSAWNVYIADTGDHEVRKLSTDGTITRIAGNGTGCTTTPDCGDGSAATNAQLHLPGGIAVDVAGNLYIADTDDQEVRKVSADGSITTIAGNGTGCTTAPACGDGGPGTNAQLNQPGGVTVAPAGSLYIADTADNEVRRVG